MRSISSGVIISSEIPRRKQSMAILEVTDLKKVYTTRLGGQ